MKKLFLISIFGFLVLVYPILVFAKEDNPVCADVGELMYGDQLKCKKGDVIIVNPMSAAFLCDMSLPNISGEKIVVCHYLGRKRAERKSKK